MAVRLAARSRSARLTPQQQLTSCQSPLHAEDPLSLFSIIAAPRGRFACCHVLFSCNDPVCLSNARLHTHKKLRSAARECLMRDWLTSRFLCDGNLFLGPRTCIVVETAKAIYHQPSNDSLQKSIFQLRHFAAQCIILDWFVKSGNKTSIYISSY